LIALTHCSDDRTKRGLILRQVSFFSRYTRDIIAFADKYTEGKVVSVLEGGYSDRALTSAAMGHVIGLLDREGEAAWWTEAELINVGINCASPLHRPLPPDASLRHIQIEKATKKKRTGKLGPFPSELSHLPHLTRAHALLAHFEGTPPDTVPSATNTPQQGSRMMLRGRRKPNGEDEAAVTPPPTASRRGRGKAAGTPTQVGARTKLAAGTSATPTPTPGAKKTATASATSPVKQALPSSASAPALAMQDAEQVKAEDAARGEVAEGLARAMAGVTLQAENRTATQDQPAGTGWQLAQTQLEQQSNLPPSDGTFSAPTSQSQESERSKVFLRFARPTPTPLSEPAEQLDTPVPTPIPAQQVHAAPPLPPQTVYPSLSALLNPSVPSQSSAQYSSDTTRQAQLAYRESSVGAASASASSTTEGEYVSATGGMSGSEAERDQREGTGETTATTATSSSEGPTMPGRFGRQ
jgi:histone deacetylase HOS3